MKHRHTLTLLSALLLAPLANAQAQSPAFMTPAVRAPRVEFYTFKSQAARVKVSWAASVWPATA